MLLASALAVSAADAPEKKPKSDKPPKAKVAMPPRHDPPDIPFRRAPMSNALRSVIIPLATNLHLAFDTELLRTHTVWQGETLNLWGTPYHGGKDRFYCDFAGETLFGVPLFPWSAPSKPTAELINTKRFLGVSTKGKSTTVMYEFSADGEVVRVHESFRVSERGGIIRELQISPCKQRLVYLAHAERGAKLNSNLPSLRREKDYLWLAARSSVPVKISPTVQALNFTRKYWIEAKNDSEFKSELDSDSYGCLWVEIPPHNEPLVVELTSEVTTSATQPVHAITKLSAPDMTLPMRVSKWDGKPTAAVFPADKSVFTFPSADELFRVEHFPLPKEIELRVNGMDFLPNGDLAVCTWTGDIYIVQQPAGDVKAATYRRFARGLCEPCGLRVINGQVYVVQKQELTRITDTDGNGEADLFECVTQDWGYTGNYHDFSYGPLTDKQGNFYVYRTGNRGIYEVPYMGWALKISPDGRKMEGVASGFRSPNGFGEFGPDRDLFMTDNQGNWIAANTLTHVQKGRFYGYPSTTPSPKEDYKGRKTFDPPAVWFPYSMAKSASGMVEITDDRFGPFKGQMLVGDFQNAIVTRVALEKVNGEYQGAVWPFSKGYWSGVNRLAFGPDGKLYVGGLKNGAWAAVAPKDWSLERVTYTGKVPFCVKEVHARPDGFELTFTQPVDPATAGNADSYDVLQYRYEYHQTYGSPEFDHDGKANSATAIKVVGAKVSADGLKVNLQLSGWKAGHVTMVRGLDVRSAEGKKLWNDTFYYTLNQIPRK